MKKETLEEAAERTFNIPDEAKGNVYFCADIAHSRRGFMQGAKWQQERTYSYIEQKWNEYRNITNNEDAWSFKEWIIKELTIK